MTVAVMSDMSDICEQVKQELTQSGQLDADLGMFADRLYSGLLPKDLANVEPAQLGEMASSLFELFSAKHPGEHNLRVYQSDAASKSLGGVASSASGSTIIEIVEGNKPFLVDSIAGELQSRDIEISFVVHPVLRVVRDGDGRLQRIVDDGADPQEGTRECVLLIVIERLHDEQECEVLATVLSEILDAVDTVVSDWKSMMAELDEYVVALSNAPVTAQIQDMEESLEFLKWLKDDNFIFLGMRAFQLEGDAETGDLRPVEGSGLGILRDPNVYVLRKGMQKVHLSPEIRKFFFSPRPLIVAKANERSKVHRQVHMDYVGVKIYDEEGAVSGELRVVGLFASTVYNHPTQTVPFIRRKVDYVLTRSGFGRGGHGYKALLNVLETYPRSELFQIDAELLFEFAMDIQKLHVRPMVRVFPRIDEFDRFVSALVFVPRNRFSTTVRMKIGDLLARSYGGRVSAFFPGFPEGQLVRIHFIIGRYSEETPQVDQEMLERRVAEIVHTWQDKLQDQLDVRFTGRVATFLSLKYYNAFSTGFQEIVSVDGAINAIQNIERLSADNRIAVEFYNHEDCKSGRVRVQIYHIDGPIPLSRRVPTLENLGFAVIEEWSDRVTPDVDDEKMPSRISIHDMVIEALDGSAIDLESREAGLEECLLAIWHGETANDAYNRLVLAAGATWREVAIVRGLGAYLQQIRVPFSQEYLSATLVAHPHITTDIIVLFHARFDPDVYSDSKERERKQEEILAVIEEALADVPSLDEDRILRHFTNLILSANRTNYYQKNAEGKPPYAVAFKFDSHKVDGIPEPKPFAEIFVYSPRVQGVHLRGGAIARGGLRWSDRPQDFRTEVLGLAKAQQVKNTVIVPTGAKGGFVPQNLPSDGDREAILKEGVACYQLFISTLLSITDNIVNGEIVPPERVLRHDGDDPYLVVAADKGTAAFSDYANEISQAHNFWLDDAFASGGSAGYDHKKMGITARGGWEAVKRHFREMDVDIQSQPVTVIGVGDMSGDVFGNGMLLSKTLKVVAAFDHRDIFIDPDPEPGKSWDERKRLFDLGRSSWQDYDKSLISRGGGVFSRSEKSILLTPEVMKLAGLKRDRATPNELIKSLLKADADLLWFGGIGTYIRADEESDDMVGDRANDALRITADDLNIKVIGEGANLGMTQSARIAFAMNGGRVNTDAIDNSAGVNSSDLEVNIKIVLSQVVESGMESVESRNQLLVEMTDEVAERCLRNNYLQTLAISLEEKRGLSDLSFQQRLMRDLEQIGLLDRDLELLPGDGVLEERLQKGEALQRPELAVLLAYAKLALIDALLESELVDDPYFEGELFTYFPKTLVGKYPDAIQSHRLKREIIATRLTNAIINRGGSTIIIRLKEETGHSAADIVKAFVAARAVFGLEDIFAQIDALDTKLPGALQLDLYLEVQNLLRMQTGWFLRNADWQNGLSGMAEMYRTGIDAFEECLKTVMPESEWERRNKSRDDYERQGVPAKLAAKIASLKILVHGTDIVHVAFASGKQVAEIAKIFFAMRVYFRLSEFQHGASMLDVTDHFDRLAINSTLDAMASVERSLTLDVIASAGDGAADFDSWHALKEEALARAKKGVDEILDSGPLSVSKLAITVAHLRELAAK